MRKRSFWLASLVGLIAVVMTGAVALASEFGDGDYTLMLPGIGDFEFTIDSGGSETVVAVMAPEGYAVDDDDPDKAAWKDAASLEVEAKLDKVEGDHDWNGGSAVLALPDGGSITVSAPDTDGAFTVTASGGWWAFGEGSDWYVANAEIIGDADEFFKVEADNDGVEIKTADEADAGFLNDLEDEEEIEAAEVEEEEEEEEDDD